MDRSASTKKALHNYIIRETGAGKNKEYKDKKNKAPERETEKDVLKWARSNGFFLHIIEASIFNPSTGEADPNIAKAEAGFSDLTGNTPLGLSCYIELKAAGKRHGLSSSQREFLIRKIEQNCFAVVVDSSENLARYWKGFCSLKTSKLRQAYLLDCLPKQYKTARRKRSDKLEKEFGF